VASAMGMIADFSSAGRSSIALIMKH